MNANTGEFPSHLIYVYILINIYIYIYIETENEYTESPMFDPGWCAPTLSLEYSNLIVRKTRPEHGIVIIQRTIDAINPFIEFKVRITKRAKDKTNLFIGLVDKKDYHKENLVSTFWKDSPSSYYWDVWNNKLICIDSLGNQTGVTQGYGCGCESN